MKPRAIDEHDKQQKRAAILAAARSAFLSDGGRSLPSVARIAATAGLAKGTVYLYFDTKEEIFLALLDSSFAELFDHLAASISSRPPGSDLATVFIRSYIDFLQQHPVFLPLACQANTVLEQNLSLEPAVAFKRQLVARLVQAGDQLQAAHPGLTAERAAALLFRCYAQTIGLHQMLAWPPHLLRQLAHDPHFSGIRPDFASELHTALLALWQGGLAQGGKE